MNEKKYSVYIHNFPNGKKYVGLTYQLPERRWNNGNGYKNQYVYNAIMEFGWDNVEHTVVQKDLSAHEASILEQELIEKYDTIKNGYNRTAGGELSAGTPYLYMYKDKKYTIYELADTFGIAYHALRWRFQKGWSVEDAVEIPQEEKYNIYRYNGKPYTVYELAEMNGSGITPHGIQTRINRGMSVEQAVETPLQKKRVEERIIDGVYHSNEDLLKLAAVDGLTKNDITNRLNNGWSLKRTLSQPKNVKVQPFGLGEKIYGYNGKMYNSYELAQLSPHELTSCDITSRINRRGWTVERAINQPKKKSNLLFEYEGGQYDSHELAQLCVDRSMTYHDVTDRHRNGWSVEEIINIPKGMSRKQYQKIKAK